MSLISKAESVVKKVLGIEHRAQIEWIKDRADEWRAGPDWGSADYSKEIERRMKYLDGDMDAHLSEMLEKEFPKSYTTMQNQIVRLPLAQMIIDKKAQAFCGVGQRFPLLDANDEEVDPDHPAAKALRRMLRLAQLDLVLPKLDRMVEECHSCAGRVCWDPAGLVRLWPYSPTKVHIAPNPDMPWDPYSARAVAFERDGLTGPGSTEPIYDVFGVRDIEVADETVDGLRVFLPSVHYTCTATSIISEPAGGGNPIVDRLTGKALYPFAWFTDRSDALYWKGSDGLVEMTMLVNLGLTWLNCNAGWQMAALPVFKSSAGVDTEALAKLKAQYMSHPKFAVDLPAGVDLSFASPNKDLAPFISFYETLLQYFVLANKLAPKSISIKDGVPQSGFAAQLEAASLAKYREQRVKIYRPQIDRLLEVMLSVWNLYAPAHHKDSSLFIGPEFHVGWEPGRMDTGPVDAQALAAKYEPAIRVGSACVDHYTAELHGVSMDEARKITDSNLERTAEVMKLLTRYPAPPVAAEREAAGLPIKKDLPPEMKAQQDAIKAAAGKTAGAAEDKTQPAPESEKKPEPEAGPESDKDEKKAPAKDVESDGLGLEKVNIYQIIKAMENGAATVVDLRMALFHEDRRTAEAMVKKAIAYNQQVAGKVGQALAAKAAPLAKSGGKLPSDGGAAE